MITIGQDVAFLTITTSSRLQRSAYSPNVLLNHSLPGVR